MSQPIKEKKVSDKDVDLTNQKRDVWLVKVPKYIADRWESSADGTNVGTIQIRPRIGPGSGPEVSFKLSEAVAKERSEAEQDSKNSSFHVWSTTNQEIPSDYRLEFMKPQVMKTQHLAVLSQTTIQGLDPVKEEEGGGGKDGAPSVSKKLSVEGKVSCRAECKTQVGKGGGKALDLYSRLKREALLKPQQTARKVQKINKLVKTYKPVANHANNIAYAKKLKKEGKHTREDKSTVMEVLFHLFEKHQYYNIKDLVRETRQPITYLKTILNEVCRYNVKNPHKNMWELKPEFRHYKKEEGEEGEGGGEGKDDSSDDSD